MNVSTTAVMQEDDEEDELEDEDPEPRKEKREMQFRVMKIGWLWSDDWTVDSQGQLLTQRCCDCSGYPNNGWAISSNIKDMNRCTCAPAQLLVGALAREMRSLP